MSTQATYIGANSAQFATGTAGYISDATSRRVWFSRRADGSDGCYVHPSDVADASQMDRARVARSDGGLLLDVVREIVASDLAGECPRCGGLAPIGGDCPSPRCVAFREWAMANQDDEETP